jgi:hypothetical protein
MLLVVSLGLEAGVDIGGFVVHHREQEVSDDLPDLPVISDGAFDDGLELRTKVVVDFGNRVLLEELAEYLLGGVGDGVGVACIIASHVKIATEGSSLSDQVSNGP